MAIELKNIGNPFEEEEIVTKEMIRRDFQETWSASTSKPNSEEMPEDKDGRKDDKPEDGNPQDDKAKDGESRGDGEVKSAKGKDDKAKGGETRGDKAQGDGEVKSAKGKDDKAKGGETRGDKGQGDGEVNGAKEKTEDTTDAFPPKTIKNSTEVKTQESEGEDGCGMKTLMCVIESCDCVII